MGAVVHGLPAPERMNHRQHAQLRVEGRGRLAQERLAGRHRAHVPGREPRAMLGDVHVDALPPQAALGDPLVAIGAPDRAGPAAPRVSPVLALRVRLKRSLEVVLHGPLDLEGRRGPDQRKQVGVLPSQVEDGPIVRAPQVGHLDACPAGEAGARVQGRAPPEHVALEPSDREGPRHGLTLPAWPRPPNAADGGDRPGGRARSPPRRRGPPGATGGTGATSGP